MYVYLKSAYKKYTHTLQRPKKRMKMTSQMYQSTIKSRHVQSQVIFLLVVTMVRNVSTAILFSFLNAEHLINFLAIQSDIDTQK